MEVVSRLSREVRTANTTGDIQELRREVSAGEYRPDPMAIAGRMMLLVEE
jgi:negative regulator of flagellin synthesis FlgM